MPGRYSFVLAAFFAGTDARDRLTAATKPRIDGEYLGLTILLENFA